MKNTLFTLPIIAFLLLLGCTKDSSKSYKYWSEQVNQKTQEITTLLESVPCTNIDEFEIVKQSNYYLVHLSLKKPFEKLRKELDHLLDEQHKAAEREGIVCYDVQPLFSFPPPNPPLAKACQNGKAVMRYAHDLSLDEINTELPKRYQELQDFYKDLTCTNPNDWSSGFLRKGCCMEGIAVHKSIRSNEMIDKIEIYNSLMERKLGLEKTNCQDRNCPNRARPVQCKDGKPFVEVFKS